MSDRRGRVTTNSASTAPLTTSRGAGWRGRIRTFDLLIQRTPDVSAAGRGEFERDADSVSVVPAGNQVEQAGRSQVNVIRSGNTGIDRIALEDRWKGEEFPLFPLSPLGHTRRADSAYAMEETGTSDADLRLLR